MKINELKVFLQQKKCRLKGCSGSDVRNIEKYFKIVLPSEYKEFLYAMGRGADKFMLGSTAFYDRILYLKEDMISTLEEKGKSLPDNTFVFWSHQGYQFAFFYLNDGYNPPVYFYSEGENFNDYQKVEESFTDFLTAQLEMSGLT